MSKVKFSKGDLVQILGEPEGMATGVVLSVEEVNGGKDVVKLWATYINDHQEEESCINEYAADELELIPDSDTKRLDFLASCFGKSEMDTIEACLEDGLKFREAVDYAIDDAC